MGRVQVPRRGASEVRNVEGILHVMPDLKDYLFYQDDWATIYCGDCRDILPMLEPVDLVLTDPPYGIGWDTDYTRFTHGGNIKASVLNDNLPFDPSPFLSFESVILWGANHYSDKLPDGTWLIWDKRNGDGTAFLSDGEIAWWNKGHGVYLKSLSAQFHRATSGGLHPTQKPVPLMEWCIKKNDKAQTILDPFMGSGTTLVAAKNLNRKSIGIEIEEKYCEIARKRLRQEVFDFRKTGV